MSRFAVLAVCAIGVAALVAPQSASAALTGIAKSCGSNCGSLDATGTGTLGVNGNGAEWGSISSGTVKVQDKSSNGHKDWSLTINGNPCKTTADPSNSNVRVCTSTRTIYFSVSTVWWLQVKGRGVSLSVVASGGVYIKGSGGYHLNGGSRRSWPSGGASFKL
ncbi:MAG TPA: hypothetical protein VE777_08715 [Gaiellales bacterium]|jgi:hypothetical protein|nr:hypothetical protein [Gaiellales bacterium]